MKITFKSLRQRGSDQPHEPEFKPSVGYSQEGSYMLGSPGQPIEWGPNGCAGEISEVHLNGGYSVLFEFESAELKNWIQRYIKDNPKEAMRLLVKMLQLAVDSFPPDRDGASR